MRVAPLLLLAACGLTQDDLDAAVAGLATQGDVDAAVAELASQDDVDAAVADLASQDDLDEAISGHLAMANHEPTTDASALTAGTLAVDRLPVRQRTISQSIFTLYNTGGSFSTGGFGNSALVLPDSGSPNFRFSIVVPEDFVGTELTLKIGWRTEEANCSMSLVPNSIDRFREGSLPSTGSSTAGFTGPARSMVSGATPDLGHVAVFTIVEGGGLAGLLPGDGLAISLFRSTSDTCTADLEIASVSILYDAR